MNPNEARLRAILENAGGGWPCLNEEDRDAIRWSIDYSFDLIRQMACVRADLIRALRKIAEMREAAERASVDFMRVATSEEVKRAV